MKQEVKTVNFEMLPPRAKILWAVAKKVREKAYAPYSGYKVGAAIMDEHEVVHYGCNVENVIFNVLHAEEAALGMMHSGGGKHIQILVCVTNDAGASCGSCRQKVMEFCRHPQFVDVYFLDLDGNGVHTHMDYLLPLSFDYTKKSKKPQAK